MWASILKLLLVVSSTLAYLDEQPYCAPRYQRLCKGKGQHIACQFFTPGASESCLNYTQIKFTRELRHFVTNYLNRRRQRLAAGQERVRGGAPLPRPELMMLVEWDRELAYLSQRLADQCTFVHDDCRATIRYPYAGQTVGEVKWRRSSDPDEMVALKAIRRVFDAWWGERRRITAQQIISPFKLDNKGTVWGHFTQLAVWKLRAVGCGAVRHGLDYAKLLLVCDFSHTNMLGQNTINPGPLLPCPIHTNRRPRSAYPLLCSPIKHTKTKEYADQYDDRHDRIYDDDLEEDRKVPLEASKDGDDDFMETFSSTYTRRFQFNVKGGRDRVTYGEFEVLPISDSKKKILAIDKLQQELKKHTSEESTEDYGMFREHQTMVPDIRYRKIWKHPSDFAVTELKTFTNQREIFQPMVVRERFQSPIRRRWEFTRARPRRPGADALLTTKENHSKLSEPKESTSIISLKMDDDVVDQLFKDTGFNPSWRRKTKS